MIDPDYPRTCRAAGRLASAKQGSYKTLMRVNLIALALAALLPVLGDVASGLERVAVGLAAIAVAVAVVSWLMQGVNRADSEWFDSRALAESIKTMAWRYAMRAAPYGAELSDTAADSLFLDEIQQVLGQKPEVASQLDCPPNEVEITGWMRATRRSDIASRLAKYLEGRVRNQKTWYSDKSKGNRRTSRIWYWSAFALQIAALATATAVLFGGVRDVSGILVTLAALTMTWLQARQSAYLAHSYGTAAQEFSIIESRAPREPTEAQLADYVEQAELAASREHTLWVARNAL